MSPLNQLSSATQLALEDRGEEGLDGSVGVF